MMMLAGAGNIIFGNLAFIFALAVGMGMAKKEKAVAALSSGIFYLIMLITISILSQVNGDFTLVDGSMTLANHVRQGAYTTMLGIPTMQMGVFGGILSGLVGAVLTNRCYKIQLPNALAFFGGTRFVPIAAMASAIVAGGCMYFIWPMVQAGIFALGALVQKSGYAGTFLYGMMERALIPFGLHHIFYLPFWQTGVGGSMMIDGHMIEGAQNIFFAQLADPNTTHFSADACRFLTGKYPFMMGGLPGAALAMYTCAKPEKKKIAGSLLFSVAITSFLTGITEPIEFTFLFLAPALFGIHVVFAGLSFMICHILQICVGTTFSDGLIDLILYGVLPGQSKTNWVMLIPVIAAYFALYFVVFRFFIQKKAVADHSRLKGKPAVFEVCADNLDGPRIVQRLTAEPADVDLLAAAGARDIVCDLMCSALRHGKAFHAKLIAVKAARVAVGRGENRIVRDVLSLIEHGKETAKLHQPACLIVLLRDEKPVLRELCRAAVHAFCGVEQQELPCQRVIQERTLLAGNAHAKL